MSMAIQYAMKKRAKKMAKKEESEHPSGPMGAMPDWSKASDGKPKWNKKGFNPAEEDPDYKEHHVSQEEYEKNSFSKGGPCEMHGAAGCEMCHGGMYAEGGSVHEDDMVSRIMSQRMAKGGMFQDKNDPERYEHSQHPYIQKGVHDSGSKGHPGHSIAGDFVRKGKMDAAKSMHRDKLDEARSMKKPHLYSEGGQVANDDEPVADFEDNQFDDLVEDDDLEQHDTGANSGDEIGDDQEDEDRRDIVSRIMKSRRKKDRMPVPA